jgi:predicted DCC family thiol-disulfide oxidoreductase YuxK
VDGTLIYDGDCGICNESVRWARAHLRPGEHVRFVASQEISDLSSYGLTGDDVAAAAWWVDPHGSVHGGHRAAAKTLERCNGIWPLVGRALVAWPLSIASAALYRWVADNRHRISRGGRTCPAPGEATDETLSSAR